MMLGARPVRTKGKRPPPGPPSTPADPLAEDAPSEVGESPWLICRACGQRLAPVSACFAMPGHGVIATFVNPGGFVHEVLTVRRAPGALSAGRRVRADSWFPDHTWRFALCGTCTEFVGWFYEPCSDSEAGSFWGLRAAAVKRG